MYTMYQGVSQSLPKTADMKFIDWWLLFCVIVPFLAFMTEILWEHNRIRRRPKDLKKSKKPKNCWCEQTVEVLSDKPVDAPFQQPVSILFILSTLAYIVGYIVLAVSYYSNSNIDLDNYEGY